MYNTGIAAIVIIDTKSRFEFPSCGRIDAQRRLGSKATTTQKRTEIQRSYPNPICQDTEKRQVTTKMCPDEEIRRPKMKPHCITRVSLFLPHLTIGRLTRKGEAMASVAGAVLEYHTRVRWSQVGRLRYPGPRCCLSPVAPYSALAPEAESPPQTLHRLTVPVLSYPHPSGTPRIQREEGREGRKRLRVSELKKSL